MNSDLKLTWRDRIYLWFRYRLERRKCDGCSKRFSLNRLDPVSGDYWLCEKCFREWYPEFCHGSAGSPEGSP